MGVYTVYILYVRVHLFLLEFTVPWQLKTNVSHFYTRFCAVVVWRKDCVNTRRNVYTRHV